MVYVKRGLTNILTRLPSRIWVFPIICNWTGKSTFDTAEFLEKIGCFIRAHCVSKVRFKAYDSQQRFAYLEWVTTGYEWLRKLYIPKFVDIGQILAQGELHTGRWFQRDSEWCFENLNHAAYSNHLASINLPIICVSRLFYLSFECLTKTVLLMNHMNMRTMKKKKNHMNCIAYLLSDSITFW